MPPTPDRERVSLVNAHEPLPIYAEQQQTTDENHYMIALTRGLEPESCAALHGTAVCPAGPSP